MQVLNMQELHRVLNKSQYGLICLNRTWICLNMSEFIIINWVLNMSHTIHGMRLLYKLMSPYWEISIFRTLARAQNMVRLWICEGYTGCWICLNMPENALIMCQYAYVILNINKYARIYLKKKTKKQSAEYARLLNVSDAVYWIRSLHKLLSSYWNRRIQNIVKHLRWSILQKECLSAGAQPEFLQVWQVGGGEGVGHFDKQCFKNTRKEAL